MATKTTAPSFSEASRAAGIPPNITREQIAELGVVTWLSATATQARNPQTGELGDGFLATIEDEDGNKYTSFIGNVVLMQALAALDFPFRARIVKAGQTWKFSD